MGQSRVEGKKRIEIAFELLNDAQGQGYSSEAAAQVIDWARIQGASQLWADVWDWNLPSRKLLARLGFVELETTGSTLEHASLKSNVDIRGCDAVTPRTITITLVL